MRYGTEYGTAPLEDEINDIYRIWIEKLVPRGMIL